MIGSSTPSTRVERAMSLRSGKRISQKGKGRSCAHPGCSTRLSRYNPNGCCATHGGWADESTRRNRDIL